MRPRAFLRSCGRRGIVLVFTILVMILLLVITLGFATFTTADAKASDANWEQTTCYYLAEAGLDYSLFLIKRNMAVYPAKSGQLLGVSPGALVNLAINTTGRTGQDHVLLSDLSYTTTNDWLGAAKYVGGFHVSVTGAVVSGTQVTISVTSVGSIRAKQGADYTQFSTWRARAQRTVLASIMIDSSDTAQNRLCVEKYYEKFR